jgi:hypothetical protein
LKLLSESEDGHFTQIGCFKYSLNFFSLILQILLNLHGLHSVFSIDWLSNRGSGMGSDGMDIGGSVGGCDVKSEPHLKISP